MTRAVHANRKPSSRAEGEAIQGPRRKSGLLRFARNDGRGLTYFAAWVLIFAAAPAPAKEIHVDCARERQSVMVDVDTDRQFIQLMWSEGVAEEYKEGDSYISGPDSKGCKEKVTYLVSYDKDVVAFGQDRICMEDSAKAGCADKRFRNSLDLANGVLKYEDGESVIMLKCAPAPPGRRF